MASKAYECWNEYWADVESNEDYSALTFYHGTSDALDISCILPAAETGFLREDWRKKLTDKVFLTDSCNSKYSRLIKTFHIYCIAKTLGDWMDTVNHRTGK